MQCMINWILLIKRTWIQIKKPKDIKVLGSIWLFKRNNDVIMVEKPMYKAILVAQGFS